MHFLDAHGSPVYEQYDTGAASPITAMASYSMRRNESVLVTGHENGEVSVLTVRTDPRIPVMTPVPLQIRTHGVYELIRPINPVRPSSRGETFVSSVFLSHVLLPGQGVVNMGSGFTSEQPAATITQLAAFR